MAKFTYIGDKESVKIYDMRFPQGKEVEVDDRLMQPLGKKGSLVAIVDKLRGNSQFEESEAKPAKSPAKKSTAKKAKPVASASKEIGNEAE